MTEEKSLSTITGEVADIQKSVQRLFKEKTPKSVIKQRRGSGGMMFPYIPIDYTVSKLDERFGIFWEDEVVSTEKTSTHIICQVKLTIKSPSGFSVSRPGFGRAAIKFFKGTKDPVDIGNDYKAAHSDALKKAASLFGIGADVYYKELEKYDEMEEEVSKEKTERLRAMSRFFAVASEKGIDQLDAKKKIKEFFKVEHMEELKVSQIDSMTNALEKKYGKTETAETMVEEVLEEMVDEVIEEVTPLKNYKCKGPKHLDEAYSQIPVGKEEFGMFCSTECQDDYFPPKQNKPDFTFSKK